MPEETNLQKGNMLGVKHTSISLLGTNKIIQGKIVPKGIEINLKNVEYNVVNTLLVISKE